MISRSITRLANAGHVPIQDSKNRKLKCLISWETSALEKYLLHTDFINVLLRVLTSNHFVETLTSHSTVAAHWPYAWGNSVQDESNDLPCVLRQWSCRTGASWMRHQIFVFCLCHTTEAMKHVNVESVAGVQIGAPIGFLVFENHTECGRFLLYLYIL